MPPSRSSSAALARLFDASAFPIYLLNEDRTIVYCNAACAEWLGVAKEELIGESCQYHSEPVASAAMAIAVGLCPPPAVFGGARQIAEVSGPAPDGRRRRGEFLPLAEGADGSAGVLAILESHDCDGSAAAGDSSTPAALHAALRQFRQEWGARYHLDRLVGETPAIVCARAQVVLAASNLVNVLITGPPGSGKDHVAKAIHYRAADTANRALVPVACAVLGADLLASTLATLVSKQTADAGATLLLNDVDELPPELQPAVLNLLKRRPPGLRVLATARQPLADLVRQGTFLPELMYLLNTLEIKLPALVERLDDLPLLAQFFLEANNARGDKKSSGKQIGGFTPAALDRLAAHAWPANLDELAQAVDEAYARCQSALVDSSDLPERLKWAAAAVSHPRRPELIVLEEFLARVETELIQRALRRAKGNKSKAAKLLGLTRPRLYRRLVQLGLEQTPDPEDFIPSDDFQEDVSDSKIGN